MGSPFRLQLGFRGLRSCESGGGDWSLGRAGLVVFVVPDPVVPLFSSCS